MDYEDYRPAYIVDPMPRPRYPFDGSFSVALYFQDYDAAVDYYATVLGPPAYVEGAGTRAWPIGAGWLTLLRGDSGGPTNVEVIFQVATPADAERLQRAFIEAGGEGPPPSDELMFDPVRFCAVRDPFGVDLLVISRLTSE